MLKNDICFIEWFRKWYLSSVTFGTLCVSRNLFISSDLLTGFCSVAQPTFESLQPHGSQCIGLPCPSLAPAVCPDSCLSVDDAVHPFLVLSHPLLLPLVFPGIRVFSMELALCIRWPEYWSFSFSISPSYEYSGFISFRIHWFDLLVVQGTLKSLLQHHSSKASILCRSDFFMVQLLYPYVTTGKTRCN